MIDKKVLVLGWDCASPDLVFDRYLGRMPNIKSLMKDGVYGRMRSCDPPITIPAWAVMATSKTPGELGMYGFRHRKGYSYREIQLATSGFVKEPKIWDVVGLSGGKACLVGIPPSYPPKPVNGCLVSGFITPDTNRDYTYPSELKDEIESLVGEYILDVKFRTDEKARLIKDIYEMTEKRSKVINHLIKTKKWDFFMFVEIGLDRVHHAFWKYFDKEHHLHVPGNRFENVVGDYYAFLDEKLGEILSLVDEDTVILVISDHGAKRMKGAFSVNKWLIEEGYLVAEENVGEVTGLDETEVDWRKTTAWGWGGYYARIFLNVEGREVRGKVKEKDYEKVRDELAERFGGIRGPNGQRWKTKVYKPEELYPECRGNYPDLMVYFDDLYWRSAGTLGHPSLYLPENDTGPDDAVHDYNGMYLLYDPDESFGKMRNITIYDVAPTLLHMMGLPVPEGMRGKVVKEVS